MRLPIAIVLLLLFCSTAQAQRKPWYEDTVNVPATINFPSRPPFETNNTKQFSAATPVSIIGRSTLLNKKSGMVLGQVLSSHITLINGLDGNVHLIFDRVSQSGEHASDRQDGYFMGGTQSLFGPIVGGLRWTIEIYDATNPRPIYLWDSNSAGMAHEEFKCGLSFPRSSSTVIRGTALGPEEIFRRAAKVRAIARPTEWTHC